VRINNLLAKNGLLKFTINNNTGEPQIDWQGSKAIFLKMDNIYVSPSGLAGNWTRSNGPEYESLRQNITALLLGLEDTDGTHPVASVTRWEDVSEFLNLPQDRVGDLVIANRLGYGWEEEMTENREIFSVPLETGYKQAVDPKEKSVWAPFIIMGPGIRKGYAINRTLLLTEEYPTILQAMNISIPSFVDGKPIADLYES
jgi:hypothetical protein